MVQAFLGIGIHGPIPGTFGVQAIPAFVLIGPDGKIIDRGMRGAEIKKAVAKALGKDAVNVFTTFLDRRIETQTIRHSEDRFAHGSACARLEQRHEPRSSLTAREFAVVYHHRENGLLSRISCTWSNWRLHSIEG